MQDNHQDPAPIVKQTRQEDDQNRTCLIEIMGRYSLLEELSLLYHHME